MIASEKLLNKMIKPLKAKRVVIHRPYKNTTQAGLDYDGDRYLITITKVTNG